jgi:hypothetical protein
MTTYFGGTQDATGRLEMPAATTGLQQGLKETAARLKLLECFNIDLYNEGGDAAARELEKRGCRWVWKNGKGWWL